MNNRIDTTQYQRLGVLFEQAVGMDVTEQAELLRTIGRDDAELAQALASLLAADARHHSSATEQSDRVLQRSLASIEARGIAVGDRIGPYVLREELGRGGMGVVYRAERADGQVQQEVALKIVKRALLDASGRERFLREREIVAAFQHPSITRMLDVGQTADGSPYLAMELIRGLPITAYCDAHHLDTRRRVEVFLRVCEAVQHAHANLVLHRDLKPSNVLVGEDGLPKLIDFGIAKPLGLLADEEHQQTATAQRFFSPSNVAPEQLGGKRVGVACDVYQLGTLLHELLCGATVFEFTGLTVGQLEQCILDVVPESPSARAERASEAIAKAHGAATPVALARELRGELDWITMKALEKEPGRRYQGALEFSEDLRRFLDGHAVRAVPPAIGYKLRKFLQRHALAVGVSAVVFMMVAAFVTALWLQSQRIARERDLAQQRAHDLDQVAKFEATMLGQVDPTEAGKLLADDMRSKYAASLVRDGVAEAERAEQLAALDAIWQRINATDTARDLVDNTILKPAVAAIDKQFKAQPLVDAFLGQTLANRYADMGLLDAALPLQQSALATRRRVLGDDNRLTLESMTAMSALLEQMGRSAAAEPVDREALQRLRRVAGENDPATVRALFLMGLILYDDGRFGEAETYDREVLTIQRRVLGEDDPATISQIHNLGLLLMYEHKPAQAEPLLREAVAKDRFILGEDNQGTLLAIENLGFLLEREGKLDQAEVYEREAMDHARHAQGESNLVTLNAISLTALVLDNKGEYAEAEKLLAPIEAAMRKQFVDSYSFVRAAYFLRLGIARTGLQNYIAAETALLEAQSIVEQTHNITHADDIRECALALVALYTAWNNAESGTGYDIKAAEWKRRLDERDAPALAPVAAGH